MTEIASCAFKGVSGTAYDFKVYSKNTSFKNVSAVYMFSKRTVKNNKGTHELLYIGESGELGTRIENHDKWPCVEIYGVNAICVHMVSGEIQRLAVETDLRNANNTPCNDQ